MGARRALIVDDSKSARLFLARALEKYDIDVDSAENAEAAIDYLTSNRPDVIFMDHMMPGMDGLQAVQAIKNDPRTATIPIMMYTSQEGELYLGQARALGAVGVLPKQIKPTDVSKVLYQLHLVPDRRSADQGSFTPMNLPPQGAADVPAAAVPGLNEAALREHFAGVRRLLEAALDTQAERITAEVRALLLESLPPAQSAAASPPQAVPAESALRRVAFASLAVAAASLLVALASLLAWRHSAGEVGELRARLEGRAAGPPPAAASAVAAGPAATAAAATPAHAVPDVAKPLTLAVPYGADALGGARLEVIRQFLNRLQRQKVTGVVVLRSFPGRFCLMGNAIDGYSLAPEEALFSKCDLVGNPSEDSLAPAQRVPLGLANLIGEVRAATRGALQVQTVAGDAAAVLVPYPAVAAELTAGEWNRAAGANNRLEIHLH